MSLEYPGSEPSIEQLVHAPLQNVSVSNSNPPSRRELFEPESQEIFGVAQNLFEVLQAIREIENTHVPVNKLPPEVLSGVLEYRGNKWDLIAATHVCRYWRSTLTSSPSLWTYLQFGPVHKIDRILTCLERSKLMTVDIMIITESLEGFGVVAQHLDLAISRTRSLVIKGPLSAHTAAVLLRNPAPSLNRLEIYPIPGSVNFPDNRLLPVYFGGIPLPNLTKLHLHLPNNGGPFYSRSLLRFLSGCPKLQQAFIHLPLMTIQDDLVNQVISLESLVELSYTCDTFCRILPYLKLPHLKRLSVSSSLREGHMNKLADLLPSGDLAPLARATSMCYLHHVHHEGIALSGKETSLWVDALCIRQNTPPTDWFHNRSYIPYGQIEHLEIKGRGFSINLCLRLFNNVTTLQFHAWDRHLYVEVLSLLYPNPGKAVPCPSLRELWCDCRQFPDHLVELLIHLLAGREKEGYRLELVRMFGVEAIDQDLEEGLKRCVGDLRVSLLKRSA